MAKTSTVLQARKIVCQQPPLLARVKDPIPCGLRGEYLTLSVERDDGSNLIKMEDVSGWSRFLYVRTDDWMRSKMISPKLHQTYTTALTITPRNPDLEQFGGMFSFSFKQNQNFPQMKVMGMHARHRLPWTTFVSDSCSKRSYLKEIFSQPA